MNEVKTAFSEEERHTFYLEMLGDADDEQPFLYEALFAARTRFPQAPDKSRTELARLTLLRLFDEGLIDLFDAAMHTVPLDRGLARQILAEASWENEPGPWYEFGTTEAGTAAANDVPPETWQSIYGW